MNNSVEYLKSVINDNMALEDIIDTFEQICKPKNEEDMILFETGTFSFTGEELFYFSLVKQFPNNEDEYYQIHLDVLYKPDDKNKSFSDTVWDEELDEDIFDYIQKTDAFNYAKNDEYIGIEIYMDET